MLGALERLADGASLKDVLGAIVEQAERRGTIEACAVVIGEGDHALRVDSSRPMPPALFERAAQHGHSERLEVELEIDGTLCSEPVRTVRGEAVGAFLVLRGQRGALDPEEHAFAELCARWAGIAVALCKREAQMSAVLDGVIDGIVSIDARGNVESFNRAAEEMFGWMEEEVIGRNVRVLMTDDVAQAHDGFLHEYARTGERRIIGIGREVVAKRRDGTPFPVDLGVSELWVGGVRKFTGILRDLTVKKGLEAQALRSQKLEAVGTLAAGVAHDFNNLLMGILGCVSIALAKTSVEASSRVFLEEAKAAAERGSKLTRQLLAFSRRVPSEIRAMSLNDVVVETEQMLCRLITDEIDLQTELVESGGPIRGDAVQIEQILVNLIVNARDAIEGTGCILIQTSEVQLPTRGACIRLTVRDSGSGMDAATQQRAFEPFFTTKGPDRGTGLGLSTVYGIVEQHGAFIALESEVGRGTSVHIDFPRHRDETAAS